MPTTPMRRIIENNTPFDLSGWVAARRKRKESWARIAHELEWVTDGRVSLHRETLRKWYGGLGAENMKEVAQ